MCRIAEDRSVMYLRNFSNYLQECMYLNKELYYPQYNSRENLKSQA